VRPGNGRCSWGSGWSFSGWGCGLLFFGGLLDLAEDLGDLALERRELEFEDGAAGVEDDIDGCLEQMQVFADGLAHAALDAVAVDGLAHDLADGEADAGRADLFTWLKGAEGKEEGHLFRELLAARLVDALVVGVFAEAEGDSEHGGRLSSEFTVWRRCRGACQSRGKKGNRRSKFFISRIWAGLFFDRLQEFPKK
jgi:hypothetical protein